MMNAPAKISIFDILVRFNKGSKIAVNRVSDDKHTIATETVDALIEPKNKSQCKPTIAPVKNNLKKVCLDTLIDVPLHLKYINRETAAIKTRYQTN